MDFRFNQDIQTFLDAVFTANASNKPVIINDKDGLWFLQITGPIDDMPCLFFRNVHDCVQTNPWAVGSNVALGPSRVLFSKPVDVNYWRLNSERIRHENGPTKKVLNIDMVKFLNTWKQTYKQFLVPGLGQDDLPEPSVSERCCFTDCKEDATLRPCSVYVCSFHYATHQNSRPCVCNWMPAHATLLLLDIEIQKCLNDAMKGLDKRDACEKGFEISRSVFHNLQQVYDKHQITEFIRSKYSLPSSYVVQYVALEQLANCQLLICVAKSHKVPCKQCGLFRATVNLSQLAHLSVQK
jgi:hypothetical protein